MVSLREDKQDFFFFLGNYRSRCRACESYLHSCGPPSFFCRPVDTHPPHTPPSQTHSFFPLSISRRSSRRGTTDPCCITGGFWSNCFVMLGFYSGWLITWGKGGGVGRGGEGVLVSTDVVSMLISVFFSFLQNIHLNAAMALPQRVKVHIPVLFKCIDPQRLSLKREGPFHLCNPSSGL